MLNSSVLGVVIGLILVYFLLSTICSLLQEIIEAFIGRRADFLEAGITDLIGPTLTNAFFAHPLTQALGSDKGPPGLASWLSSLLSAPARWVRQKRKASVQRNRPSYLEASTFSKNLISIFADGSAVLAKDIDASAGSISVSSSLGLPTEPGFKVQADNEIMKVTRMVATDAGVATWTVERGDGATPHKMATVLTRMRSDVPSTDELTSSVRKVVEELPEGPIRTRLSSMFEAGVKDLDRWRTDVEGWFNEKMDRVSGWYKRRTKLWLFAIGLVLVFAMNADTAAITRALWTNQTLRDSVVNASTQFVQPQPTSDGSGTGTTEPCPVAAPTTDADQPTPSPVPRNSLQCLQQSVDALEGLDLPIGWPSWHWTTWASDFGGDPRVPHNAAEVWLKLAGLLLTALALTLGAPFWFDLLNKVANVRSSGGTPSAKPASDQSGSGPKGGDER